MSIDWLIETFKLTNVDLSHHKLILEQAKAMHKREHIETYNQGYRDAEHDASNIPLSIGDISEYNNAENYYNETYNG